MATRPANKRDLSDLEVPSSHAFYGKERGAPIVPRGEVEERALINGQKKVLLMAAKSFIEKAGLESIVPPAMVHLDDISRYEIDKEIDGWAKFIVAFEKKGARRRHREVYVPRLVYLLYLKTRHWQDMRHRAFSALGERCSVCGSCFMLNIHHKHYRSLGRETLEDVCVLCQKCHGSLHTSDLQGRRIRSQLLERSGDSPFRTEKLQEEEGWQTIAVGGKIQKAPRTTPTINRRKKGTTH